MTFCRRRDHCANRQDERAFCRMKAQGRGIKGESGGTGVNNESNSIWHEVVALQGKPKGPKSSALRNLGSFALGSGDRFLASFNLKHGS